MSPWKGSSGKPGLISHIHPISNGEFAFLSSLGAIKPFLITAFGLLMLHRLPKSLLFSAEQEFHVSDVDFS